MPRVCFSPAVSLTTLTFATVLAMIKPGPHPMAAARQEPNGDEFRSWFES
ncbi:MAG TPA: hypothetical protein VK736_10695 [Candidatus Binatia bacterium]|nr:hypothetical protein [Candidatus Binatia bacterium]